MRLRWREGDGAGVGMSQLAASDAVDAHDYTTERIGANHSGVRAHPIHSLERALFGGEQWQCGLQRVDTEGLAGGQAELAAVELEGVADGVTTRARATNFFDDYFQVVQLKGVVGAHVWS